MADCKAEKEDGGPSKRRLTSICVFGESRLGKDFEFITVANDLGKLLAARKINLVYGGGISGLRGCVATAAFLGGSRVLGILLKDFVDKNIVDSTIGTEVRVSSMHERMGYMLYSAQAFIALPGGPETLNGISSIVYWASLNFHNKPLGLLNINGYYDGLLSFLDHAVEQEFISQATRGAIMSASTAEELIDQLQIYVPKGDPFMKQVGWQPSDSSKKHKPDTTLQL